MSAVSSVNPAKYLNIELPSNLQKQQVSLKKACPIGKGGFSRCFEYYDTNLLSTSSYAVKVISKRDKEAASLFAKEVKMHSQLEHRNIVKFHTTAEDTDYLYIILEYCDSHTLEELVQRRGGLTEPEVGYYLKNIVEAVMYCHEQKILHGDLKLENIFLQKGTQVKLGDFGLATKLKYFWSRVSTQFATVEYMAPEIVKQKSHRFQTDVWAVGIMMYTMLFTKTPFVHMNDKLTCQRILNDELSFPQPISKPAKDLLEKLLTRNPKQRATLKDILQHPFLSKVPASLPNYTLFMKYEEE